MSATTTINDLEPGNYIVTASKLDGPEGRWSPTPANQTVAFAAGGGLERTRARDKEAAAATKRSTPPVAGLFIPAAHEASPLGGGVDDVRLGLWREFLSAILGDD